MKLKSFKNFKYNILFIFKKKLVYIGTLLFFYINFISLEKKTINVFFVVLFHFIWFNNFTLYTYTNKENLCYYMKSY